MGWLSTLQQAHGVRITEAFFPPSDLDLRGDSTNPARAYRRLSEVPQGDRSLMPMEQDRMIEIAAFLRKQNPLAHRIIQLLVDYIVGEGFTYKVQHDALKTVIDEFWNDDIHSWHLHQAEYFDHLFTFGDQAYPLFVDRRTGRVRMSYLEPLNIRTVEVNPFNVMERVKIHQKSYRGIEPPPLRIVYRDEEPNSRSYQRLTVGRMSADGTRRPDGTFYFTINGWLNATRGMSDLLAAFDWLDLYDQYNFGQAERAGFLTDFVWDVELQGFTPDQQKAWLRDNPLPQGRSMRVHNEKVKWDAKSPQLHAADTSEMARLIRGQAVMSHGLPEGWLYAGGETNRSTLSEQAVPVLKYLSRRQQQARAMMQRVLSFVRDQAILAGHLSGLTPEEETITVEASEVSTVDLGKISLTLKDITAASIVAEDHGYFTHEEAAGLVRRIANELGTDLPPTVPVVTGEQAVDMGIPPQSIEQMARAAEIGTTARALGRELVGNGDARSR